jgi:hypothetical protein
MAVVRELNSTLSYQEEKLFKWILDADLQGLSPPHDLIHDMAYHIFRLNDDNLTLGLNWVNRFISRHEELKTRRMKGQEGSRIDAMDYEVLERWVERFQRLVDDKKIAPTNMWNMDEKCQQLCK